MPVLPRRPPSCVLLAALLCMGPGQVPCCDPDGSVCGARREGDIMLGILMAVYGEVHVEKWARPLTCRGFDVQQLLKSLAMIHAIEEVNAVGFLPGLSLGYYMCDTCSNPTKALQNVEHMLALNGSLDVSCSRETFRPQIKAFLGGIHSEVSIAVAKLLSVHMVPQVSSTSSSPALSDKSRYPAFLRTIPSDVHQTKAMAQLMAHYNWTWVGVVYEEDDYGTAAFHSLLRDAAENHVCLAYQEVVPHRPEDVPERIEEVAWRIRSTPDAQVVVLILKSNSVEALFKEMIRTETSRTWIASDSWSSNRLLVKLPGIEKVGNIFGMSFVSRASEPFDAWLKQLRPPGPGGYNNFIREYKNLRFKCTPECFSDNPPAHCSEEDLKLKSPNACDYEDPQEANDDFLVTDLDTSSVYNEQVAVWAVAHALRRLLGCNDTSCAGETDLKPWMLLERLHNIAFELNNTKYFFDKSGDFVTGYDVMMWVMNGSQKLFRKIGRYYITPGHIKLDESKIIWHSVIPVSRCSPPCQPGTMKKILDKPCCYNCTECHEGTFTNASDLFSCETCPEGMGSGRGSSYCELRREVFLRWKDHHPIALVSAAVVGLLLLLAVFVVFMVHRDSQPMRRAEVRLSCVMMVGLAASFASVICFMGRPSKLLCCTRQVVYAMGFTLCVACILVKAFRTFLVFLPFGQLVHRWLYKLYKPPAIVFAVTALQGVICTLWLVFDSPYVYKPPPSPQSLTQLVQCYEGRNIGFGVMLGYIALLALAGFVLAFKGRKVPQEFSETGYILFSMLMYLFVWVCFIPVYILKTTHSSAIQASAILVSSYGIVFCHFLPKCYEALWRLNGDPLEMILRRWRMVPGAGGDLEGGGDRRPHAAVQAGGEGPYQPDSDPEKTNPPGVFARDGAAVRGLLVPRRRKGKIRSMSL